MVNKRNVSIILLTCILAIGKLSAQSPIQENITVVVKSDDGKVLSDVQVIVDEGILHLLTGNDGKVQFESRPGAPVTFYKQGFVRNVKQAGELQLIGEITLTATQLFASEEDVIPLPFNDILKRYSVGSSVVLTGDDLEQFSSSDIRNSLTGLVAGIEVVEKHGAPGMTALERINRWGSGSKVDITGRGKTFIYMVDGVPVDIAETPLDPQEIETVTIVRDVVEKALYGAFAANGVVFIKTKTGRYNDRVLNVSAESGISFIDRMPEYTNGTDYARLNNIARRNSGLDPLYSEADIAAYALNNPYDTLFPNANFRDLLLKESMDYNRVSVSSGGGNNTLKYYAFLGYTGEGDILKIGPSSRYDRVNLNSNLSITLNDFITSRFGIFSSIAYRKSPNYGYSSNYSSEDESSNTTIGVYEFPDIIQHVNLIPGISFPAYWTETENISGGYVVSDLFQQNPVGNMMNNGYYTESTRRGLMYAALDMDFGFLLKGLSANAFGSFDATNMVRLGKAENYDAYIIIKDPSLPEGYTYQKSSSHTRSDMANKTKLADYLSQRFFGSLKVAWQREIGEHNIDAALTSFITKRTLKFITEHRREVTNTFSGRYAYKNRYLFQTALSLSGTYSLENNRYALSPTFGVGWILSEEDFLKEVSSLDFLKIKAEGGLLHYDGSMSAYRDVDNFSWQTNGQAFGPHTNNQWFGSTTGGSVVRIYPSLIGNPDLRLEQRKEFSAGIEAVAFKRRLTFEANYYNSLTDGPVTQVTNVLPSILGYGDANPWMNYNRTRYYGLELALGYRERICDFYYSVNANATIQSSKVLRVDELDYPFDYMKRTGLPNSAIFGLKYAGTFTSDQDVLESLPQLFDSELHAGDLKYTDMNGDGVIDDNDRCMIGNSLPKLLFGLHVNLGYKNFDFSMIATGRAFYDVALTNSYFWSGWGDNNYSKFVYDNASDPNSKYPKLSYYKVNNNYKLSDFWLERGDFLKIQNVEIGYNLPVKRLNLKFINGLRLYVHGSNLLTVSKIKDVDPESLESGLTQYPLFRSFAGGIKLTF
ncbi:MAG: SusC/RagA family TonB-linked outer membrane protein [Tannerella sp.]|jgi:TonB-linked SusC/RagA family outer membrane protein|nr:SusC/RagA family TonB-linked outer membrane protein [Tannerella sp.]